MALKGTTKIELTNVKTGEVEVIEKENLVTNAVADILGLNPFGSKFREYETAFIPDNDSSVSSKNFENQFFPLCPNLFGGILLYGDALEEDSAKYFADIDNPLIGYSSKDVNVGLDIKRGSMNQTESGALEDGSGYRFVFDFATSQANGAISSLGLTSKMGGVCGYGSLNDLYNNFVMEIDIVSGDDINDNDYPARKNIVSLDPEKNEAIYAYVSSPNYITIGRLRFPMLAVGLREVYSSNISGALGSESVIKTETFASVPSSNKGIFYGTLIDGGDGYIWGFQHENNTKGNESGNATILWIKINKEDYSFEEGTVTVDAQMEFFGEYPIEDGSGKTTSYSRNNLAIKDGFLYAIKYCSDYRMSGVYKIPLENPTNVTLLQLANGDTSYYDSNEDYYYNSTNVNVINGVVKYRGAYVNGENLYRTNIAQGYDYGRACLRGCAKPGLIFGPFIFGIGCRSYGGVTGIISTYIQSCYLATINNLATPVQKTADKTMKITYILREETA